MGRKSKMRSRYRSATKLLRKLSGIPFVNLVIRVHRFETLPSPDVYFQTKLYTSN